MGELYLPGHTGKPVENGKACEGQYNGIQAYLLTLMNQKWKLLKLTKLIEQNQKHQPRTPL